MPTIEVGTVSQQWKQTEALWKALHWWIGKLCWAHIGSEHTVTFLELAVDFELTTGERLPDVSDRRIQPPTMRKTKTTTAREILPPSEAQSGLCLYFDGGSRQNGTALAVAGAGAVVYEDGKKIAEVIVPLGRTTNNVAEFSALVGGLHLLGEQPPSVQGPVTVRGDSKVVISTMKKTAQCKPILRPYLLQATASMGALAPRFNFNLEHVARDRNTDADALSNAAMDQVQEQTSGEVSTVMAQYEAYRRTREILPPSEAQSGLCLYFDGGSRQNGTALAVAGAGAVVYEDGKKIAEVIVPLGRTTNNVAEFSALVGGLHLLGEQPPSVQGPVTVRGDSKVVISTMKKTAQCKPILRPYLLQATASMGALAPRFNFNLEHVARDRNTDADALSNAAMDQVQAQTSGEVSTVMAQYEAYRRNFQKCFDSVPIEVAFKLAEELGFNEVVLRTLRAAYTNMRRHFRVGATVGEGFVPTNGIMQGCPLSVILINVIISVWMRHVADIEAAIPLSYVDDVYAMLKTFADLEEAARRSGMFAGLTGMKVCTQKKSHFFTTASDTPQTLDYAESDGTAVNNGRQEGIQRRVTFDVLGVMLTTEKVPPGEVIRPSKRIVERNSEAERVLKRAACLPLPGEAKDLVVSMSAGAKRYYGAAVSGMTKRDSVRLRRLFTEAMWTGPPRRAQEAVLHILHHGHRLDPVVVPAYRRITTWAVQLKKWESARSLSQTAWEHSDSLATLHGPFAFFKEALDGLGWRWVAPTSIAYTNEAGDEVVHDAAAQDNTKLLQHDLRYALRLREMAQLAARRGGDFGGVRDGVDYQTTRHLLEMHDSPLTAYQAGMLKSVIVGATPAAGRTGAGEESCLYCNTEERETVDHLFWSCPAWEHLRAKYEDIRTMQVNWPPCLRLCGIAPAPQVDESTSVLPAEKEKRRHVVKRLQLFFVEVLRERQGADGLLDRSARHHRTESYPRGWRPTEPCRLAVPFIAPSAVTTKWKYGREMWMAFTDWLRQVKWAPPGHDELGISFIELAVEFEMHTGQRLPDLKSRYYTAVPQAQTGKVTAARTTLADGEMGDSRLLVCFDGGARANGTAFAVAGAGAVMYRDGVKVSEVILPLPTVRSNNVAEYEAVLAGLHLLNEANDADGTQCTVRGDSALVVGQLLRRLACSEELKPYQTRAARMVSSLQRRMTVRIEHVKRERNTDADALRNAAMDLVQRQRPTPRRQEKMLTDFRRYALGKALSLVEMGKAYKKVTGGRMDTGKTRLERQNGRGRKGFKH
ncbi:hypothetical protein DIPPA_25045 [Diplonema papillatum]|nr:hypothetical protein DIPPA_25045 [Diplonema papillatum]